MRAGTGDRIVVRGKRVGDPDRTALVLSVDGDDGAPPFRVRWNDGHEAIYFPGSDALVERRPRRK